MGDKFNGLLSLVKEYIVYRSCVGNPKTQIMILTQDLVNNSILSLLWLKSRVVTHVLE